MTLLSTSDRIQVTKYPPLPHTCIVCNFSADGKREFLDWGVNLDYYGAVVVCSECATSVGLAADMVPVSRLNEAVTKLISQENKTAELIKENGELRATIDSLVGVRPDLSDRISDESAVDETDESNTKQHGEGNSTVAESERLIVESNSGGKSQGLSKSTDPAPESRFLL